MTSNSDGLTPTLRPQLGVGWNRALPAPFGFDNCLRPDGVNDYLVVPRLAGTTINGNLTFECWIDFLGTVTTFGLLRGVSTGLEVFITINYGGGANATLIPPSSGLGSGTSFPVSAFNASGKNHLVICVFSNKIILYINGGTLGGGLTVETPTFGTFSSVVSSFRPLSSQSVDAIRAFKFDEYRMYNRVVTSSEVLLNFNNGMGENPCVTEPLLIWYKFQEFENLDFSALQDNSDIRLGMRDLSGKNNHAQPINMDTNPASPNYVLKPF